MSGLIRCRPADTSTRRAGPAVAALTGAAVTAPAATAMTSSASTDGVRRNLTPIASASAPAALKPSDDVRQAVSTRTPRRRAGDQVTSPVEAGSELFVVGVSVEASVFTGPDTRALPVVTLHLQASSGQGAPPRDLHVHFQATGLEAIGDAIADAAVDAVRQADQPPEHPHR